MIFIDRFLSSGVRFVLDKVAMVVNTELNDATRLREELMEAQMRFELGEISEEDLIGIERAVSERLREIRARERGTDSEERMEITGIEVSVDDDVEG
jgi:hypothetical protein